ncbi:uncharacterized protein B0I36DRAFT_376639 [Microdochium trichocladiopsis]|uniref:Amine oxidase domain-containing protein n=1 Tax=Microdochium trichocladiopsis TaxID=1682393 RepID=A0A9P8XX22_9PEZI|nr:uncharacterized protein B0I36DRAFT_376639 [Microdochium trichocladiopsis]KAH7024824.1 hypothetical protein B0I36DRAFT_376639 [Microdochium trichocladiopsis]
MSARIRSTRSQWAARLVREKLSEEITKLRQLENQQRSHENDSGIAAFSLAAAPPIPGGLLGALPLTPLHLPPDDALDQHLRNGMHAGVPDHHFAGGGGGGNAAHGGFSSIVPGSDIGDKHRICIVGAGVAGLFIAMILDSLDIPGLEYELLEASDRAGGRMLTHYFSKDVPHDYDDIGAMRFPKIGIMDNTFKLFSDLNIPLIPYYLQPESTSPPAKGSVNCPTMYNDITVIDSNGLSDKTPVDPFHVSQANGGSVPDNTVDRVSTLLDDAFGPFKKLLAKHFESGFATLLQYDNYSTRDGLFDQGFTESVMDSFDFDAPEEGGVEKWFCIDGGTSLVTEAMEKKIKQPVQRKKRVNKFSQDDKTKKILVSVVGEPIESREPYTTVFNTTSLACLQRIDLTGLNLHPSQKDAIRTLHYDDSAKVAIKFSYPWWITKCGISSGGTASTDLPIRTCVYPSYNIKDPKDKPAVLLCSYTWAQDATRIGSLIKNNTNGSNDPDQEELKNLILDNLARLHLENFRKQQKQPDMPLEEVRQIIGDAYVEHHAFSWSHDPFTSGAFALFGPGQFANLYPYLSRPGADSRFHICGEASSAHHAWIVGALDSALASVHRFLRRFELWEYREKLEKLWITPGEVEDDVTGTLHLQVALGKLPQSRMVQV